MAHARRRAVTLAVAMAIGVATIGAPGAQASHAVTRAYAGNHDPFLHALVWWSLGLEASAMCAYPMDSVGSGGACFYVPASAHTVAVAVDDASGFRVTGGVTFRDTRGRPLGGTHAFCEHTEVAVPPGADRLIVTASAYASECGIPGTAGTITTSFR